MKRALGFVMLAAAFAAGTAAIGWWALPVIAAAWGWVAAPERRPGLVAALAALAAWGALTLYDVSGAAFRSVVVGMGQVLKVGSTGYLELGLLFPFLVALAAASATSALRAER